MRSAVPPLRERPVLRMKDMGMDHGSSAQPMDHSAMGQEAMAPAEHADHGTMIGALGPYPMMREASGTAWQPDASEHLG